MNRKSFFSANFFLRQFALTHSDLFNTDFHVLLFIKIRPRAKHDFFNRFTNALAHTQPRKIKQPTQARCEQHSKKQRRENLSNHQRQTLGNRFTQHTAVLIRQRHIPTDRVHIFQAHAGKQHHDKTQTIQQCVFGLVLLFKHSTLLYRQQTHLRGATHPAINRPSAQQDPPIR